jgi:Fe-S-cluster-containing dehydrogenase component
MSETDLDRRRFLQLMGASLALTGGACSGPPPEKTVPYVDLPPELRSNAPLFYATAFVLSGYAYGVLVESSMGRAIKVEGNASHPASLGATNVYAQASVLQLWDPERSQAVYQRDQIATWEAYDAALESRRPMLDHNAGEGLRVLTGAVTSPTLIAQLKQLIAQYPRARWHAYDPLADERAGAGMRLAFGRNLDTVYSFDEARVVVALDTDFIGEGAGSLRYAHDFTSRRKNPAADRINRLYALESTPTLTGAMADQRLTLPPQEIERAVWRIAAEVGTAPSDVFAANPRTAKWEAAVAAALRDHRGASIIVAGARMSPETHALVHGLNARLGNISRTMRYIQPVAANAETGAATLADLANDMHAGRVDTLIVLGGNPAYDAPADLEFASALGQVALSVHSDLYRNETGRLCTWHIPSPHEYEQWSDARAYDGTASILQPVMRPLYAARASHEVLARLTGNPQLDPLAIVRAVWRGTMQAGGAGADDAWRESLRRGFVEGTAAPAVSVTSVRDVKPPALRDEPLVAAFVADSRMHGGEYANNAWLQELPHPITTMVWDNALLMSAGSAKTLALETGEVVRVQSEARSIDAPVWICPGHADGVVTLPLGRGRRAAGSVGNGVGFDAYRLHTSASRRGPVTVSIERTGRRHTFVTTQNHASMDGRDIVRTAGLAEFLRNPDFAHDEQREKVPETSLYPPFSYPGYAWGMAIDLNSCMGCGACTIACQAENNIAVVGKEQVARGREMHWIRVDRYYEGADEAPRTHFQPVPCMHCENAPCEEVCPVGATVHDSEGLNVQVYNRCVGTRFCSQNCPYKVRRFNFLQYSDQHDPGLKAVRNPEVTVRQRGVMEKCTYCLQRITRARIEAEKEGRRIRDGEMVTACQAVCPTKAITFGDLNDPASAVRRVKDSPLNYSLLAELNTRPRTSYLAKIINPDPDAE